MNSLTQRVSSILICFAFVFVALSLVSPSCQAQSLNPLNWVRTAKNDVQEFQRDYVYEKPFQYSPSDPWNRGKVFRMHTGHWGKYYNCDGEESKRNSPYICWAVHDEPDFPRKKGFRECVRCEIAKVKQRIIDGAGNCGPGQCDGGCVGTCNDSCASGSCGSRCAKGCGISRSIAVGLGRGCGTGGRTTGNCSSGVCRPEGFVVGKSCAGTNDCGLADTSLDETATSGLIVNDAPRANIPPSSCNCVECKLNQIRRELEAIQNTSSSRHAKHDKSVHR